MTTSLSNSAANLIDQARNANWTSDRRTDPAVMFAQAQALLALDIACKMEELLSLLKDAEWLVQTAHRDGEEVQIVSLLTE